MRRIILISCLLCLCFGCGYKSESTDFTYQDSYPRLLSKECTTEKYPLEQIDYCDYIKLNGVTYGLLYKDVTDYKQDDLGDFMGTVVTHAQTTAEDGGGEELKKNEAEASMLDIGVKIYTLYSLTIAAVEEGRISVYTTIDNPSAPSGKEMYNIDEQNIRSFSLGERYDKEHGFSSLVEWNDDASISLISSFFEEATPTDVMSLFFSHYLFVIYFEDGTEVEFNYDAHNNILQNLEMPEAFFDYLNSIPGGLNVGPDTRYSLSY